MDRQSIAIILAAVLIAGLIVLVRYGRARASGKHQRNERIDIIKDPPPAK